MATRSCPLCGHTLKAAARFCGQCGHNVASTTGPIEPTPAPPVMKRPQAKTLLGGTEPVRSQTGPVSQAAAQNTPWPEDETTRSGWVPTADVLAAARGAAAQAPPGQITPRRERIPPENSQVQHVGSTLGYSAPKDAGALKGPESPKQPFTPIVPDLPPDRPRTSLGLGAAIPPGGPAPPNTQPVPGKGARGTILGVAMPGIAPLAAAEGSSTSPASPRPQPTGRQRTMLGGLAAPPKATDSSRFDAPAPAYSIPAVLPAPIPPQEEELPEAPEPRPRSRFPVVLGLGAMALLLLVGAAVVVLWRGPPPLSAQPQLDDTGKEALRIRCESCPDGTKVSLAGVVAEVKGKVTVLPLAKPLVVGDNTLSIRVETPDHGRGEEVTLKVPVAYRIRTDLTTLAADPPVVTVRVEALPGTAAEVDGKTVQLDASGRGNVALDLGDQTIGPSDESRVIDRTVPFTITPAGGKPEQGTLRARTRVVPLHLDAPGSRAIVASPTCRVTGQTVVGASVTVNGVAAPLGPRGEFATDVPCPTLGPNVLELIASGPGLASRKASLTVTRVPSLEAEARVWESKPLLGQEALTKLENVGKPAALEGNIVESRVVNGLAVLLVENLRGCRDRRAACLVRVVYGGTEPASRNAYVRVYGTFTRTVTANGKSVPEVEASFLFGRPR